MSDVIERLYEAWERELAQVRHEPDVALIAALEWRARELGFDLVEIHNTITEILVAAAAASEQPPPESDDTDWEGMATDDEDGITEEQLEPLPHSFPVTSAGLLARLSWDPDLHPRGHDGKFIETLGLVKILRGKSSGGKDLSNERGSVVSITPDPKSPGRPTIQVRLRDGEKVNLKPDVLEAAPEKARLDVAPAAPAAPAAPSAPSPSAANKYAPKNTTLTPDQAVDYADQVKAGQAITVNDVDVDDVISNFVDAPEAVDLTLMSQFSAMRNGGGRSRADMPQIPKDNLEDFKLALDDAGIAHQPETVDPRTLTATQNELDGKGVAELIASTRAGTFDPANKPVWISSDNKVLDGHHRWAAAAALAMDGDGGVDFPVIRVDMPMDELLDFADEFNDEHGIESRTHGEVKDRTYVAPVARAKSVQQQREELTASINEAAAKLSTTDAEERAAGLDEILSTLRFSIIDTNNVHDNLFEGSGGQWTPERDAEHEVMWDEFLADVEKAGIPKDKDSLVLGGLPGAGKSFSLKPGQHGEKFGVVAWEPGQPIPDGATHVSVNPDIVKEMLIERGMLPPGIVGMKPMEQVNFIHEESSYLGKKFSQRLADLGYNIILDNTMDSDSSMKKRMTPLARNGYRFRAMFVDIPVEESKKSARQRYLNDAFTDMGGRFVPSSVQGNSASSKGNLSKNRDAFDTLVAEDWFHDYMVIDNTGIGQGNPKKEVVLSGTGTGSAVENLNAQLAAPWRPVVTLDEVDVLPPAPDGAAPDSAPAAPAAPIAV